MLQSLSILVLGAGLAVWMLTASTSTPLFILCAIIIHEAGHLCAAYLLHMKPSGAAADTIGIRLLFRGAPPPYGKEILLCAAGPLANLLSLAIGLAAGFPSDNVFLSVSAALALLNLLPIEGFDGGRMVHSTLLLCLPPSRADKVCELLSFFFLFVLWCISVYLMMRVGNQLSLFFFSTAIFFRIFLQKKPL